MFGEIEKEYRKGLQEQRFKVFYWPKAILVVVVALNLVIWTKASEIYNILVYVLAVIVLLGLAAYFFIKELRLASKVFPAIRKNKDINAKLKAYFAADDAMRIDNLVSDLRKHNMHTKTDIELAFNYYKSRLPVNAKPSVLEWFLTTMITLSSIIIVTYDDEVGTINMAKLISAFGTTMAAALVAVTPFLIAKLISVSISRSRSKLEEVLVEDLAYVYANYEKYSVKLNGDEGRG